MTDVKSFIEAPPSKIRVAYNTRDLLLYAIGIGSTDPRYVYEKDPNFAAFPTYPICLTFKGDSPDVLSFPPPAMSAVRTPALEGVKVGLDAEKIIEKINELPTTATELILEGRLAGVHKRGSGALTENIYELKDETGKIYYRIISAGFAVGAKNFKDAGVSFSRQIKAPKEEPKYVIETKIDEFNANIFRLSGDYNPLHVDPQAAKKGGFETPIIHGLCSLGHTTRCVLDAVAGGDAKRFKSVRMRFASPVIPGQTLQVRIWPASATEVKFETMVKETGKVCISNGMMELHPAGKL
eukprot:CAMPEP_0194763278 /NCGR_PEP_ID=MMETSP0323_2-20130528/18703_1 /TAXON_ID=2866 ORGANISM="Crypthecodinium cohnii, Strain Seligo" /NCGR_SAMPLE_ID=MMETSP0323_2 /ASSEMBLY_ACC=CAM_ASM_000346 /LENGTH=295 /DNA_ID=CAMNT_0039687659 /DNA_START=66 /DNA_END=953 /DNA_ORIENTATION=+